MCDCQAKPPRPNGGDVWDLPDAEFDALFGDDDDAQELAAHEYGAALCSQTYRQWRPWSQLTFQEAQKSVMRESRERAAMGDYNRPATRTAILGRMREHKWEQWQEHARLCNEMGHDVPDAPAPDRSARRNPHLRPVDIFTRPFTHGR